LSASIATVQGPVPVQAPLQPTNTTNGPAAAVSVTTSPPFAVIEQSVGQSIPAGALVTPKLSESSPAASPASVTFRS
jgi:hypothetical protein